ncbi:glycosyltransferase family 8 protein [Aspergillus stella-maris]|uniref:glycosyltransferase family 8 protein n=1 Tax=Aspergillus stella-maris TaxID=1810926 RepID=UPI003CCD7223
MVHSTEQESQAQAQAQPKKVWTTLITNLSYLPGLLTLHHSLLKTQTRYPFIALYTPSFPAEGLEALKARNITTLAVPAIQPQSSRKYEADPRFNETWNKLVVFSLTGFERVILLDGDMLVRRGMDELMDTPLDGAEEEDGNGNRVFAATHACACNPMKKAHYPARWIPSNCAYTPQHSHPESAQKTGSPVTSGVGMLNSGLLVVRPSLHAYKKIQSYLSSPSKLEQYTFPDQELLSEAFQERWVPLPYIYNALKTMRDENVHGKIWRDEQVKNVHYIFAVKPWQAELPVQEELEAEAEKEEGDVLNRWWWEINYERQALEKERGVKDGY